MSAGSYNTHTAVNVECLSQHELDFYYKVTKMYDWYKFCNCYYRYFRSAVTVLASTKIL